MLTEFIPKMRQLLLFYTISSRNRFRRLIWDLLSSRRDLRALWESCLYWERRFPFLRFDPQVDDPVIAATLKIEGHKPQFKYLFELHAPTLMEPKYGYVIALPWHLVDQSLSYSDWTRNPEKRHLIGLPSPLIHGLALLHLLPTKRVEAVLSLRFPWEENYSHFWNDVLPKLLVAEQHGIPADLPVVVGGRLARQSFFQEAAAQGVFGQHEVIVQTKFFIKANRVIFCQPFTHSAESFRYVVNIMRRTDANQSGERFIFLTRSSARGRNLLNEKDVESTCMQYGFEIVDTDGMALSDQVRLFSEARYVAGVHGSGLMNLIFAMGHDCGLLEIFPPEDEQPFFAWICPSLGFDYDAIFGTGDGPRHDRMQPFRVDVDLLAGKLDAIRRKCDHAS